jgi:hypothetical protein
MGIMIYEWNAVFERDEILTIDGGQEEIRRRIIKSGKIDAEYGQQVIQAVIEREKNTGNLIQMQMRVEQI